MPSVRSQPYTTASQHEKTGGLWRSIAKNLNFFRVHLLFFTFTPTFASLIFYASNGETKIAYIDCLFNCVSAITVCGLATVDLSSVTTWQQVILFILMSIGSPVVVSWFMVLIRRYYFARKFQHIIEAAAARKSDDHMFGTDHNWKRQVAAMFRPNEGLALTIEESEGKESKSEKAHGTRKVRPDMIRRMDDAPRPVNPSGWVSEGKAILHKMPSVHSNIGRRMSVTSNHPVDEKQNVMSNQVIQPAIAVPGKRARRISDPGVASRPPSPAAARMHRYDTVMDGAGSTTSRGPVFPRTQTIEFAPDPHHSTHGPIRRGRWEMGAINEHVPPRRVDATVHSPEHGDRKSLRGHPLMPNMTVQTHATGFTGRTGITGGTVHTTHTHLTHLSKKSLKHRGFGGFPMPHHLAKSLFLMLFPDVKQKLERTMTIPATMSLVSNRDQARSGAGRHAPYLSSNALVGRNSTFHIQTSEQLEELKSVEYRALNALLYILPAYHFGIQIIGFSVIAPYISAKKWHENFIPPRQHRVISPVWFSAFIVVSSYTNTGMSLVDQSMVPFQRAYPVIAFMALLILAGNTAFPIFLRFMIWCTSKLCPENSQLDETLHFLLDHPRRCFIYLFPSHQTWFLLTIVLGLTFTDWFFFMVLDIGTSDIESIPLNVRFLIGFLQAVAVRAAGFGAVSLALLAPAVKVLYVIMMYISVYPIAMSVRSTNVYEEQSLGIFPDYEDDDEDEKFKPEGSRMTVWSKYLAMHMRKQLAFDMWWLGLAVFLVCIIERRHLDDPASFGWFNIFTVIFELVSAYGTVGLSLGIPDKNYSFSGAFHPLSKLIVCVVMIRGRHRGLPVAIDRAVMVPNEFKQEPDERSQVAPNDYGVSASNVSQRSKVMDDTASSRWRKPHIDDEEHQAQEHNSADSSTEHDGTAIYPSAQTT
ncbi:cation transport protein-domain-containing protein [Cyathus striatus]|nr:cation transport protein-domain-containing protein [Cyathus striatus]